MQYDSKINIPDSKNSNEFSPACICGNNCTIGCAYTCSGPCSGNCGAACHIASACNAFVGG